MIKRFFNIISFINNHPFASRHRFKSYIKLIEWQVFQAIFRKEKIVGFVGETKLSVSKGMTGATGNIYTGLHEFNDMGFLLHSLQKDELFFDIGANVGTYSILASGVCKSKTYSFEPNPDTFTTFIKNINLNQLSNLINPFKLALGSEPGIVRFSSHLDTMNHVLPDTDKASPFIETEISTVDHFVHKYGCPTIVKMDVEGFELEVLNGMKKTLNTQELKAIIIEINSSANKYGQDDQSIHNCLIS